MIAEAQTLLVTAETALAQTLSEWLTAAGYGVSVATSGAAGLAALTEGVTHLVIWDTQLPDAEHVHRLIASGASQQAACGLLLHGTEAFETWGTAEVVGYLVWPASRVECVARVRGWLRCQYRVDTAAGQAAGTSLSPLLLRALIESLPHNVFSKDREGRFTFASQRFCTTQGKALHEILGKTDFAIHPSSLAEKYRADDLRVIETGEIYRTVEVHRPLGGEKSYVQVIKAPLYTHGHIAGVLGVFWDITQRKHAEAALVRERDLLYTLMDNIPDTIYFKDADLRFTRINRAQAQVLGLESPHAAIGKTDFDFFPQEQAHVARNDERDIIKTGQPLIGKVEKIRRADGQSRWVMATKVPVKNSLGEVSGIVGISRDITERVRAEEALRDINARLELTISERTAELRAQYARLDAILHSITEGVVVVSPSGGILLTNPVAETWMRRELCLDDARQLLQAIQQLAQAIDQRTDVPLSEVPTTLLELSGLDLELRAAPIIEKDRATPSTVVIDIHDVSALKAMERMKTNFITNVSHELRTPVTAIKLYAHLMERHPERWHTYLPPLVRQADHQARLIKDIVTLARLDAGRVDVQPHLTHLPRLLESVLLTYRGPVKAKGLTLHLEIDPADKPPIAEVDPAYTQQALYHLLDNALCYTEQGGIVVRAARQARAGRQWATVTVEDTGVGISAEDLPHIFQRFFRGHTARHLEKPGAGLGLAIVEEIVKLHGGDVTVRSEEGHGTTLCLWLPLAPENGAETTA